VFQNNDPSQNKNKKRECVPARHTVGGNGQAIAQRKENDHPRSQTNDNAIARIETSKPTKDARHRLVASVKRFDDSGASAIRTAKCNNIGNSCFPREQACA
jgi:hypothetical protein